MKFVILLVCLFGGAVLGGGHDHKPHPRPPPRFPFVIAKPFQSGKKEQKFGFKFGVVSYGNATLDVNLVKIVKFNFRNRTCEKADFDLKLKLIDVNKTDIYKEVHGDHPIPKPHPKPHPRPHHKPHPNPKPHPKPHPRPHHKHHPSPKPHPKPHPRPKPREAILGYVGTDSLSCHHQGMYFIGYGRRPNITEVEGLQWKPHPHPRPSPVQKVFIRVNGCRPPPRPSVGVLVKPVKEAVKGKEYSFEFGVVSMNSTLDATKVKVKKINVKDRKLEDVDFTISLKEVDGDEIHPLDSDKLPKPKYALAGHGTHSNITCSHQGEYLVAYDTHDTFSLSSPIPRPHPRPILRPVRKFRLGVKGCPRPKPMPEPEPFE